MAVSTFEAEKIRVLALLKQRQYSESLEILEQIKPGNPAQRLELLDLQAVCYFRTESYDQAAVCYQQLCEENPRASKPLINLGAVYNRIHQFEEAVTVLRKAIQYDKANCDAYYNLGLAQKHSGRPDLAISAYKEALRLNPKLEHAHLNLANIYLSQNNTVMATNHYRSALVLNPDLEPAKRGLQRTMEREQENEQQASPFGRLVDITQLSHQKSAAAIKNLSEAERQQDREEVLRLTKGIRNAGRHVSEEIREKMQPALLALTRSLIDGENRPGVVAENHKRFHQDIVHFQEGWRYLKRSVLELRGHEEFQNTPDFD